MSDNDEKKYFIDPDSWRNVKSYLVPNNAELYKTDRKILQEEFDSLSEYLDNKYGMGVYYLQRGNPDFEKYTRAADIGFALEEMENTYQEYGPLYGRGNPLRPQIGRWRQRKHQSSREAAERRDDVRGHDKKARRN